MQIVDCLQSRFVQRFIVDILHFGRLVSISFASPYHSEPSTTNGAQNRLSIRHQNAVPNVEHRAKVRILLGIFGARLDDTELPVATLDGTTDHQTIACLVDEQRTGNVWESGGADEYRNEWFRLDLLGLSLLIGGRHEALHGLFDETRHILAGECFADAAHAFGVVAERVFAERTVS